MALRRVSFRRDRQDVFVIVQLEGVQFGVDSRDDGAVAGVGAFQHVRKNLFRLGAFRGLFDETEAHEIEDARFAGGVDVDVGVFLEEYAGFETDGGAKLENVARGDEFVHALQDVEVADGGRVEAEFFHFVCDLRRRPSFSVIGEKGMDVHVDAVVFRGELRRSGQRRQFGAPQGGIEG